MARALPLRQESVRQLAREPDVTDSASVRRSHIIYIDADQQ
jgi:hypothetical protein